MFCPFGLILLALPVQEKGLAESLLCRGFRLFSHYGSHSDFACGDTLDVDPSFRLGPDHLGGTA